MIKVLWKQLLQPHVDYCSQLYYQGQSADLSNIENLQRTYTKKFKEVQGLNYWDRLKTLELNSQERRIERYRVIYTWKCLEGLVPDCGILSKTNARTGRHCVVEEIAKKSSQRIQTLKEKSFTVNGPRLFNCLPKKLRNLSKCTVEEFKYQLDDFLKRIPDQPKTPGMEPEAMDLFSAKASNSIIDQVRRLCIQSGG